jgi:hypothetical protein
MGPPVKNETTFTLASKLAGPTAAASCTQSTVAGNRRTGVDRASGRQLAAADQQTTGE